MSVADTVKTGAKVAKTTAHVLKTGAQKTNEFLHSEGVQNAKEKTGSTIQNMVKAGATKASNLFSKMKEFYKTHINVELNNADKEALQNYRDSLQDTINKTPDTPIKNGMQETVNRLDKVLKQDSIRTKDVAEATKPLSQSLSRSGRHKVPDTEDKQIDEVKLSMEEVNNLSKEREQYRNMANLYENMPEADRKMLGISDEKVNGLTQAYRNSADKIDNLIVNYNNGKPIYPKDVDQVQEPLTLVRGAALQKDNPDKNTKTSYLKKDEKPKNFDLTKDEKANRFDLTKDEKPKLENVPVKSEDTKRVTDIDKAIEEAGKKQEQDKKDGLRKEKSQEIEK